MDEKDIPIIELLLANEGHVPFDPNKHNKFHFTICRLVKDEIREHKWIEGEKGRKLTWEDAVNEWMQYHYDSFVDAVIPKGGARGFIKYHFDRSSKVKA